MERRVVTCPSVHSLTVVKLPKNGLFVERKDSFSVVAEFDHDYIGFHGADRGRHILLGFAAEMS